MVLDIIILVILGAIIIYSVWDLYTKDIFPDDYDVTDEDSDV